MPSGAIPVQHTIAIRMIIPLLRRRQSSFCLRVFTVGEKVLLNASIFLNINKQIGFI
jgi:hypothetical protein